MHTTQVKSMSRKTFWIHVTYQNSKKYKKEIQVMKFTNQEKGLAPEEAALLNVTKHLKK